MTSENMLDTCRIGVLDIGSNSVRFVIYELYGAAFSAIFNEKVLAGLGRDLARTGALSPKGKDRALAAIRRFTIIAKAQKLEKILVGATAALRLATDAREFIDDVKIETGVDISPISGREEARLTALGLIAAQPRAKGLAADLGGASLELIQVADRQVGTGQSLPIGPFQMINPKQMSARDFDPMDMKAQIISHLEDSKLRLKEGQTLYLIGGAWRNLAGIHMSRHLYPMKTLQAYELMPGTAQDLARWSYTTGLQDVLSWPGLNKRRAETIPYSGILLDVLLAKIKPPRVVISTTGLREGLVYDAFPESIKQRDALRDGCRALAAGNLQGLDFAEPLYDFLSPLDEFMPACFTPDNEERLRRAACQLVGIGKGLHPDYRADLVFEDVLYAPLAGLTHKERAYLALVLFHSFTSAVKVPNANAINLLLSKSERHAARIYGSGIRLGIVASGRSPELLRKISLSPTQTGVTLNTENTYSDLITERVTYRLSKFIQLLGN